MWGGFLFASIFAVCCCSIRTCYRQRSLRRKEALLGAEGHTASLIDPNNPNIDIEYLSRNRFNPYLGIRHNTMPGLLHQADIDNEEPVLSEKDPRLKIHPLTGKPLKEYGEPVDFDAIKKGKEPFPKMD